MGRPDFFFAVEKIYEKTNKQEDYKESHVEWLLVFFDH